MQTWQNALLSKVSSAQLCQVLGSKGQARWGRLARPGHISLWQPRDALPRAAASSCSACCQGCWDSQLPPTLPHPQHKVPSTRPRLCSTGPWEALCLHTSGESGTGVQSCSLHFTRRSSPRKRSHTGCSGQLCPLCPCSLPSPCEWQLQSTLPCSQGAGQGAALITPSQGHSHKSYPQRL